MSLKRTVLIYLTVLPFLTAVCKGLEGDIGVSMHTIHANDGTRFVIAGVALNSPASEAGLQAGQIILSIDGISTRDVKLAEGWAQMRGPVGTKVILTVKDTEKNVTN